MITKAEIQELIDDCSVRIDALDAAIHPIEMIALLGESMALLKIYVNICVKEKNDKL